jgi:hypothetical protein
MSTYQTAVKNFASIDKPSTEDVEEFKNLIMTDCINAVLLGESDIDLKFENDGTKWGTAKTQIPKTLISNLERVIINNTKKVSYTLDSDLGKFLFGGVKAEYGIEYAEGEFFGMNAPANDFFFEEKEMFIASDIACGKYSLSIYFVTKEAQRDDYKLRDFGHIMFKVDSTCPTDPAVSYNTELEAKAAAKMLCSKITENTAESNISKEEFASFAVVSHDTTIFYENIAIGTMVEPIEEWVFEATTEGSVGLLCTTYGWHIMYYAGESEEIAWRYLAHDAVAQEDFQNWFESLPYNVRFEDSFFAENYN